MKKQSPLFYGWSIIAVIYFILTIMLSVRIANDTANTTLATWITFALDSLCLTLSVLLAIESFRNDDDDDDDGVRDLLNSTANEATA